MFEDVQADHGVKLTFADVGVGTALDRLGVEGHGQMLLESVREELAERGEGVETGDVVGVQKKLSDVTDAGADLDDVRTEIVTDRGEDPVVVVVHSGEDRQGVRDGIGWEGSKPDGRDDWVGIRLQVFFIHGVIVLGISIPSNAGD